MCHRTYGWNINTVDLKWIHMGSHEIYNENLGSIYSQLEFAREF